MSCSRLLFFFFCVRKLSGAGAQTWKLQRSGTRGSRVFIYAAGRQEKTAEEEEGEEEELGRSRCAAHLEPRFFLSGGGNLDRDSILTRIDASCTVLGLLS